MVLIAAATVAHMLERAGQPKVFGNIPDALWWAVVTLTTTGYGDVVPQTVGGKMVGSVVMVSGILVLALMTGILATGFAEEERRREYLRVWDQVTRVPMFAELGTVTLSEIVEQAARAPLSAAHRRGAPRRAGQFDVLHLRGRGRGAAAARRDRAAARAASSARWRCSTGCRAARRSSPPSRPPCWCSMPATSTRSPRNIPSLVEAVEREARRRRAENQGESRQGEAEDIMIAAQPSGPLARRRPSPSAISPARHAAVGSLKGL